VHKKGKKLRWTPGSWKESAKEEGGLGEGIVAVIYLGSSNVSLHPERIVSGKEIESSWDP